MFDLKAQDQGTIVLSQQDYLPILNEPFLSEGHKCSHLNL
jgi:hypothetical protein